MCEKRGESMQTLVAYVENKPGVLNRVSSLARRLAINNDSLTVGPTENEEIARMTIVAHTDERGAHRLEESLEYFFFFKQKTAYEIETLLEFRRVLFRSTLCGKRSLVTVVDGLTRTVDDGDEGSLTAQGRPELQHESVCPPRRAERLLLHDPADRSEERRVGKERRARWGRYRSRKRST